MRVSLIIRIGILAGSFLFEDSPYMNNINNNILIKKYSSIFPIDLKKSNGYIINARLIHKQLEIGKKFATWITDKIYSYNLIENEDYITKNNKTTTHNNGYTVSKDYLFKISSIKDILIKGSQSLVAIELYNYFSIFVGNTNFHIKRTRNEINFGLMLDKITGYTFEKQYSIDGGKYRLDFYLPDVLIVEYDEKYHTPTKNLKLDKERMEYCRKWLHDTNNYDENWYCPVIRVKQGEELEGLNRIIRHLVGFEMYEESYNYDVGICDYGIR